MNKANTNLCLYIWSQVWPFLSGPSRKTPPTHIQKLFYFGALGKKRRAGPNKKISIKGSGMDQHRDNWSVDRIKKALEGELLGTEGYAAVAGAENSQIMGSDVVVYTEGDKPQIMALRYPSRYNLTETRKCYEQLPCLQMECGKGTVSILSALDDFMMTHEVYFKFSDNEPVNVHRFSFAMRWLQSEKDFYVKTCGMRMDKRALQAVQKRKSYRRSEYLFPENR